MTVTINDFNTKERPQWCPGCGNYALLTALKGALAELGRLPHEVVIVSGIGCSGKVPHYLNTYGFEGLHGRPVPVASAIKMVNPRLTVIAEGGDGDGYQEGIQHFLHVTRRNHDITYIVHDNQIYGLTTGQASSTSLQGMKTKTTPWGVIEIPFNPILAAIDCGATYVARGFSGEPQHLKELIKGAITHKGFALVDVFQPCVTFNKLNTYEWFRERIYKLEETGHNPKDKKAAREKAEEDCATDYKKVPIGLFYKEERPTYEDQLPQVKDMPLVEKKLDVDLTKELERLS
ncbi:MAG: thiamine pyrophosphate-dependent enzyme [Candidatus Bilamarchaeaceae archaeon]